MQFFHEFIWVSSVWWNERKHSKMMSILRKDVGYQNMDEWEKLFYGNLTEYAFSKVQKQLKLSWDMKPVCTKEGDHYLNFLFLTSYFLKIRFRYFLFLLYLKEINFSDDLFSRHSFLQILRGFLANPKNCLQHLFYLSISFFSLRSFRTVQKEPD